MKNIITWLFAVLVSTSSYANTGETFDLPIGHAATYPNILDEQKMGATCDGNSPIVGFREVMSGEENNRFKHIVFICKRHDLNLINENSKSTKSNNDHINNSLDLIIELNTKNAQLESNVTQLRSELDALRLDLKKLTKKMNSL